MELGEKLKQARLEMGLSQRQLCGEEITRNMLSQIENGSARPSMDTLRYLARRLGKTVSWFLEEDAVTSPNQAVMEQARTACRDGDFRGVEKALEAYRQPDGVFDTEKQLLERLAALDRAEQAVRQRKNRYAARILEDLGALGDGYCREELERRRLLLLARARPEDCGEICGQLPGMDGELLVRARGALNRGDWTRAGELLDAAEDRESSLWNFLRGEVWFAGGAFREAAACFHRAEPAMGKECAQRLESCYREIGDFERAYFYACAQR